MAAAAPSLGSRRPSLPSSSKRLPVGRPAHPAEATWPIIGMVLGSKAPVVLTGGLRILGSGHIKPVEPAALWTVLQVGLISTSRWREGVNETYRQMRVRYCWATYSRSGVLPRFQEPSGGSGLTMGQRIQFW